MCVYQSWLGGWVPASLDSLPHSLGWDDAWDGWSPAVKDFDLSVISTCQLWFGWECALVYSTGMPGLVCLLCRLTSSVRDLVWFLPCRRQMVSWLFAFCSARWVYRFSWRDMIGFDIIYLGFEWFMHIAEKSKRGKRKFCPVFRQSMSVRRSQELKWWSNKNTILGLG